MGSDSRLERINVKRSGQRLFGELEASKNRKRIFNKLTTWDKYSTMWRRHIFTKRSHISSKATCRRMKITCPFRGSYCSSFHKSSYLFPQIIFSDNDIDHPSHLLPENYELTGRNRGPASLFPIMRHVHWSCIVTYHNFPVDKTHPLFQCRQCVYICKCGSVLSSASCLFYFRSPGYLISVVTIRATLSCQLGLLC